MKSSDVIGSATASSFVTATAREQIDAVEIQPPHYQGGGGENEYGLSCFGPVSQDDIDLWNVFHHVMEE